MEYTNDVILGTGYESDTIKENTYEGKGKIKKILEKLEADSFLAFSSIVSVVILGIDFLIVKKFIELIKLL